jgi:outer membrane protein assembly factor BamB
MRGFHIWAGAFFLGAWAVGAPMALAEGTIDAGKSVNVTLPAVPDEAAVAFKTSDGKEGWVKKLSGDAIPTPAFANGKIYTGGGMSSRLFMAINAATGKTIWSKPTQDNGPTSPVVEGKYVAYNTESCHTESRDSESGELLWSEVTGGSLLTQPVIADGSLIIPHPTMARKAQMADDAFRMLGVDLATGKHSWDANMTGDVLAAPVGAIGHVFFTCTDGRLFCSKTRTGGEEWHVVAHATSAPVVVGNVVAVTTTENGKVCIRRFSVQDGSPMDEKGLAPTTAGAAVLAGGQRAEWDYQGPKIAARGWNLFNAPGQTINSVDGETGKTLWTAKVTGDGLGEGANSLTPPALGKVNLYLGTARGQVLAVKQADGTLVYGYAFGQALASQPILADGNLYFGTTNGMLVCLKLNDADAKDWTAWGGNAQHNKVE